MWLEKASSGAESLQTNFTSAGQSKPHFPTSSSTSVLSSASSRRDSLRQLPIEAKQQRDGVVQGLGVRKSEQAFEYGGGQVLDTQMHLFQLSDERQSCGLTALQASVLRPCR